MNSRSIPWARALTSTDSARIKIQASACRQLRSPKINKKTFKTKINANIFRFETFIFYMAYLSKQLCLYLIFKLLERAHI